MAQIRKSLRKQEPLGARIQTQQVGLQEEKKEEKVIAQEAWLNLPKPIQPTHAVTAGKLKKKMKNGIIHVLG